MTDPLHPIMDIEQAAEYLRVSKQLIRKLIKSGDLPSAHVGRRVLLRRKDIDKYIENRIK